MSITIHNLKTEQFDVYPPWDVRVDRSSGSPLGNDFRLPEFTRDESCEEYAEWFLLSLHNDTCIAFHNELLRLKDIYIEHGKLRLFCFCAPLRCHAETIMKYLLESGVVQERNAAVLNTFKTEREENKMEQPTDEIQREQILSQLSPHNVLAFDTETEEISYTNPIPPVMCMTYSNAGELHGNIKTPWEHRIDEQFVESYKKGQHSVGHSTSFDLSVLAFQYPELLPHIFDALDKGLIHDTLIREKLLNLTLHGNFEMVEVNGCMMRLNYKLCDLEKKYLNIDRSALKDDPDAPRTNYGIYKNVPVSKWHEDFISYAVDDAINTGQIYQKQEEARAICIETTGYDPFKAEAMKVRHSFALRLLECVGERMDPQTILEVTEKFTTEYNQPRLRDPLLAAGLLLDAVPPQPYAKGTLDHTDICNTLKDDKERKKLRTKKLCGCPVKMKAAVAEKGPTKPLFQYIWNLAHKNPNIEAWPSDGCASDLRKAGVYDNLIDGKAFLPHIISMGVKDGVAILPDDIKLKTNEEWSATCAHHDPLLSIWAERKALRKIITDYLPKMFYTDEAGLKTPATIIRPSFYPLCLTGRSSSSASKLYPSRNGQNVDPRVRPCTIPRDGNIIISTDYNGMELGTLAQKCVDLFGHSVLANKINDGIDTHAFLAAQIAAALDVDFAAMLQNCGIKITETDAIYDAFALCKGNMEECNADTFCANFRTKYKQEKSKDLDRPVVWNDFFKYFRLLAKPTGLGFPGGMSPPTVVVVAKASYKLDMSIDIATKIREVWLHTYPEMKTYLAWINKSCKDPLHSPIMEVDDDGNDKKRTFYCYDTRGGLHRARCGYCEAANGAALQAPSAEGALDALYNVQKAVWTAEDGSLLSGVMPWGFLHDEIVWESPEDKLVGDRVRAVEKIMVDSMQLVTPNVKAGAESAGMRRWNKYAEPIWDDKGNLIAWVPEPEKKGV